MSDDAALGPPGDRPPGESPRSGDGEPAAAPEGGPAQPGDVAPSGFQATPESYEGDVAPSGYRATPESYAGDVAPSGYPATPPPSDQPGGLEEAFLTIWLHPRATIRRIVSVNPGYGVIALAAIGGITQVLASASRRDVPGLTLGTALLGAFVGGPVFGVLALYVGAWLTRLTGRWWLHGQARPDELRAAFGWASLPHVVSLPLWLLALAAYGEALFTETGGELAGLSPVYLLFTLAVVVLQIWGIVIASAAVAEVQGYRSGWKGFANILLALLLFVAVIAIVFVVLALLVAVGMALLR